MFSGYKEKWSGYKEKWKGVPHRIGGKDMRGRLRHM